MKRAHCCTMGAIPIASICLVALFILTPGTNAQESLPTIKDKVSLEQKIQPVLRSYPGVRADILGIRTGMTVSAADAIADKSYDGKSKPWVWRESDSLIYGPGDFSIQSHPFIAGISFTHQAGIVSDFLTLHFGSPVTGNTLLGMSRQISYYQDAAGQPKTPPVSALEAIMIKKYGPTSYQTTSPDGGIRLAWVFGPKKRVICKTQDCVSGKFTGVPMSFSSDGMGENQELLTSCGTTARFPNLFRIDAKIDAKKSDKAEVSDVAVSIWDAPTCVNDAKEAKKQLTAAAMQYYAAHKPAPAPGPKL